MTISDKSNLSNPLISNLIEQLQEIQSGNPWLGVNFEKKLKLLDKEGLFYKPNELHSVAELLYHLGQIGILITMMKKKLKSES